MAEQKNHRDIGVEQELFMIHPLSPGSIFFLPSGVIIYNNLMNFLRQEYKKRGFTEVITPCIYNIELWKISGHWEKYQKNMFSIKTGLVNEFDNETESEDMALKPMNCPGHCLIFDSKPRSLADLPIRLADFGVLHRNEMRGALTGLTRVRKFQQDDAHIFCSPDDVAQELKKCLEFISVVYGKLELPYSAELSTRPETYIGDLSAWNSAEETLKQVLNESGIKWKLNPGDGAFYGPKIDFHVQDSSGKNYQCATIQLDFQLPERFKLEYFHGLSSDGSPIKKRPVIIHRAIFGSLERMIAILCEHYSGKWPFWLSPKQIYICTLGSDENGAKAKYCDEIVEQLLEYNIYVDKTADDIRAKIKSAQEKYFNYVIVIGNKEVNNNVVNIRNCTDNSKIELSARDLKQYFSGKK